VNREAGSPLRWTRVATDPRLEQPPTSLAIVSEQGRFFFALGGAMREREGVGDGDMTSARWLPLANGPKTRVYSVAVAEGSWYVASDQGLQCRRQWRASELGWWQSWLGGTPQCGL
jgi:hypothetical protein